MTSKRLTRYEQRYRELAGQLGRIGLISPGSLTRRYTLCGKPGCRCQADPPEPHGPYWQWTRKVAGKTVTRRLTGAEARLYAEWIANERKLRKSIAQMEQISRRAIEILLTQVSG